MGSAEEKMLQKPQQATLFIEDMTAQQKAEYLKTKAGVSGLRQIVIPSGLQNLGNTCYLNACLQVLRRIDEFQRFFADAQNL